MPTIKSTHGGDPILTNVYWEARNADGSMIADLVAPVVNVGEKKGKWPHFANGYFSAGNRDLDRAKGASFERVAFDFEWHSFETQEQGVECPVDISEANTAQRPLDLYGAGILMVKSEMDLWIERKVATAAFTGGNWTNGLVCTGGNEWNQPAPTKPVLQQLQDACNAIRRLTGRSPNRLTFGAVAWQAAALCPEFLSLVPFGQRVGAMTPEGLSSALSNFLKVNVQIDVGFGVYNSAHEGQAVVGADVWGDFALLHYQAPATGNAEADKNAPTSMKQLCAYAPGTPSVIVEQYDDDTRRQRVTRLLTDRVVKVVCADAGYLFTDIQVV